MSHTPAKTRVSGFRHLPAFRTRLRRSQSTFLQQLNTPDTPKPASGVPYYGYRFYAPELGRWINRDPIGERGGLNVYGIANNDVIIACDILGLVSLDNNKICCDKEKVNERVRKMAKKAWEETAKTLGGRLYFANEYCGRVCCNHKDGSISDTGLKKGFYSDDHKNPVTSERVPNYGWFRRHHGEPRCTPDPCPDGTDVVGDYHSHPLVPRLLQGEPPGPSVGDQERAGRTKPPCPECGIIWGVYDPNLPGEDKIVIYGPTACSQRNTEGQ